MEQINQNKVEKVFGKAFKWGTGISLGCSAVFFAPFILLTFFMMIIGILATATGTGNQSYENSIEERTIKSGGLEKIAVIRIKGPIVGSQNESLSDTSTSAEQISSQLEQAKKDSSVKAVILAVDSPGGGVTESVKIFEKINEFKKSNKPIYAYYENMSASGGYYASMSADKIYSHRSAWVGSIGVIMEISNLEGLYEKIGYKKVVFKSGALKDIGSDSRPITLEEQKIFQGLVDDAYNAFVEDLSTARKLEKTKVLEIADGKVYTAKQAQENGLIDSIGGFGQVASELSAKVGLKNATIIEYKKPFSFSEIFYSTKSRLENFLGLNIPERQQATIKYLWSF